MVSPHHSERARTTSENELQGKTKLQIRAPAQIMVRPHLHGNLISKTFCLRALFRFCSDAPAQEVGALARLSVGQI